MKNLSVTILIFLINIGCKTALPQLPVNDQSSIIGISINIMQPLSIFTSHPKAVYFVRMEDDDIINQNNLISSNYYKDDIIYLLNARPGRYIAVAAFEETISPSNDENEKSRTMYNSFYFPYNLIKMTEVELMPGDIAFMGTITVKKPWSLSFSNPDEAQLYYCRLLQPEFADAEANSSVLDLFFTTLCGSSDYAVAVTSRDIEKDLSSEFTFLKKSINNFKGSFQEKLFYKNKIDQSIAWIDIINRRIEKLKKIESLGGDRNEWIMITGEETE